MTVWATPATSGLVKPPTDKATAGPGVTVTVTAAVRVAVSVSVAVTEREPAVRSVTPKAWLPASVSVKV